MRKHDGAMRLARVGPLVVAVALAATGCQANAGGGRTSAADCTARVRVIEVVYASNGYTNRDATRLGVADRAVCHDVGEHPRGSVFPERVRTWEFPGYPPEKVVGVRFDKRSFAVFVAESVSSRETVRILEDLSRNDP
jgi:hypothetical protein